MTHGPYVLEPRTTYALDKLGLQITNNTDKNQIVKIRVMKRLPHPPRKWRRKQ